ncbi:hypothetical protein ACHHYP_04484 [Achlya hypogyna]|uniref:Secreted protein n=1 Tax=Achlya hypogyna TaxID=1202772 RepID=A0A0A7CNJ4_ACHHY|nr:secreted protein [Achlya hypogyna]OQR91667.1 hypothetical protein ACHHYP_04484 [Achlya hypogyna]
MKLSAAMLAITSAGAFAQFQNTCSQQLNDAVAECQKAANMDNLMAFASMVRTDREKYCTAMPGCAKLQALAPSSDCVFWVWKGHSVNPSKDLTCPERAATTLCTPSRLAVSEGYGLLYANTIKHNTNEQFVFNNESQTIVAKSNGQCLDVYKENDQFKLHTYACSATNGNQKWVLRDHKVRHATHGVCLQTDLGRPGAAVGVAPCTGASETNQWFDACDRVPEHYIQLQSATGKHLLEYNGNVFVNPGGHDFNDIFQWENSMLKSASSGQCLDAYRDSDNQFKLHMYQCDANNGNQKWTIADNVVKHATHPNLCLDADPSYADQHVQVWTCGPNNRNQQWTMLPYSK